MFLNSIKAGFCKTLQTEFVGASGTCLHILYLEVQQIYNLH